MAVSETQGDAGPAHSSPAPAGQRPTADRAADAELAAALARILPPERVLARPFDRIAYASDASFYRLVPRAVAQPVSAEEVRRLLAFAGERRLPVTFRAAGTSLSGQAVTEGLLVDLGRHFKRLEVEEGGARVRVEPGVIGGQVNRALARRGRRIGPDPASIDACMIGGILANNASGMCCGVAENAYHTLASLTCVLASGLTLDTADPRCGERLAAAAPEVAAGLLELKRRIEADAALAGRIRAKYRLKNTTGYSLNAFLDFAEPHRILAHLLIGSEGTLAFIAEAVLATLPAYPLAATGLLLFADVPAATAAVPALAAAGARALELMDRAALRSVEGQPGAPEDLAGLPPGAAALLAEVQCADTAELAAARAAVEAVARRLPLLAPPGFTEEPARRAALWRLRKGLYPSIGAARRRGTAVVIEDVAFPLARLAEAVPALQELFAAHGYDEAILFGHAKEGNLHFVLTPRFDQPGEVRRYEAFMAALVELVARRFDGALKAEHGTGRNVAPFVEAEWGGAALSVMRDLKDLLDPGGILNPGVILNPDPRAHLRHLKGLPEVEEEIDRCIECGFCEPLCPSRRLTTTPRQRIVVRREIARLRATGEDPRLAAELEDDYRYAALDTCAADGLCATACPVAIDTGALVQRLRGERLPERVRRRNRRLARHLEGVETGLRRLLRLGHLAAATAGPGVPAAAGRLLGRVTGRRLPLWGRAMPRPPARLPVREESGAAAVYWPSCLSRLLGVPPAGGPSLAETLLTVADRADFPLRLPRDCRGTCCGLAFASRGDAGTAGELTAALVDRLWAWSEEGRLPVVLDASSCAGHLRSAGAALPAEARERWGRLTLLDPVELLHDRLLPRLAVTPRPGRVAVHPTCAVRRAGLEGKLLALARRCAEGAEVPFHLDCCGGAGDRGLRFPELPAAALAAEAAELQRPGFSGFYSSNPTCEMTLAEVSGRPFRSIAYLVEEATRPGSGGLPPAAPR